MICAYDRVYLEWDTSAGSEWQEGETDGLRTYVCKSCGGEIVGDANMAATSCPFCDNPIIMMGQFAFACNVQPREDSFKMRGKIIFVFSII